MRCPANGFKVECKKCDNKQCYNDTIKLEKELSACWYSLYLKDKYKLIQRYEKDYNLKIKIYDNILIKLYQGRFNAFVLLPFRRENNKKIRIYISKKLLIETPLSLLEYVILHEIGHTKAKLRQYESCADSFALCVLGSNEYIKRKTQFVTYFKYRTFDVSQLKKLQDINIINFIKLRLHLISLEDL